MAPGRRSSIQAAAAAMAGPESRPSGSTIRTASTSISWSWLLMTSRCAWPVTITGSAAPASWRMRSTVSWNSERAPSSGRNCLGRDGREAGHRRVPEPPQRITGTTVGLSAKQGPRTMRMAAVSPTARRAYLWHEGQ